MYKYYLRRDKIIKLLLLITTIILLVVISKIDTSAHYVDNIDGEEYLEEFELNTYAQKITTLLFSRLKNTNSGIVINSVRASNRSILVTLIDEKHKTDIKHFSNVVYNYVEAQVKQDNLDLLISVIICDSNNPEVVLYIINNENLEIIK